MEVNKEATSPGPGLAGKLLRDGCVGLLRIGLLLLSLLLIAGIFVRLTIQDAVLPAALIFYSTPLGALVIGAAVCTLLYGCLSKTRFSLFWLLITIALSITWVKKDWQFHETAQAHSEVADVDELKVLFWNVARRQDLLAAARQIREIDPDVVGLVEVQGNASKWKAFWKEQLPDLDVSAVGGGMYFLARGTSGEAIAHDLGGGSHARQLKITIREREYEFLLVDIFANPLHSRGPALGRLTEIAESLQQQPTVILGDFNTPADSLHLKPLRRTYRLCFESAGNGYAATWPTPLPLMQLDQIWINQRIIPRSCQHSWTWASDHLPVEAIISIAP